MTDTKYSPPPPPPDGDICAECLSALGDNYLSGWHTIYGDDGDTIISDALYHFCTEKCADAFHAKYGVEATDETHGNIMFSRGLGEL